MNYNVELGPEVRELRRGLSPQTKRDFNDVVRRLHDGPDREIDLQLTVRDDLRELWRAKAGRRWRVIFEVLPNRRIQILEISRRPDAYDDYPHSGYQEIREPGVDYESEQTAESVA